MRREIRLVQTGEQGEDLLRRIPTPANDDVVLPNGVRRRLGRRRFDALVVEVEDLPGDRKGRHTGRVFSDLDFHNCPF
jgi:hypothetical protein